MIDAGRTPYLNYLALRKRLYMDAVVSGDEQAIQYEDHELALAYQYLDEYDGSLAAGVFLVRARVAELGRRLSLVIERVLERVL